MVANEDVDANLRHSENDLWVVGGIHCLELSFLISLISLFCFDGKALLLPLQAIPVDGRETIREKLVEILKVRKTEGATAVALHGSVHWMHFRKL